MTCRIDRLSIEQGVVLRISGRIAAEDLEIVRATAVKLLAFAEANGIELRHCPAYIREWVVKERESS